MARSVVSIDDLADEEIEAVFQGADRFLDSMASPDRPHRVKGRFPLASNFILCTLFYEPSTRTRLSFESAMMRLGGEVLSSADPATTSASKGETIADTVRVVENYADMLIIRHPCEGAARVAAEYSSVPVINAGDGSHEHPTQTLCDLYTLRTAQKKKGKSGLKALEDMNVVLWGDLKHGRTVHSLVFALARLRARIIPFSAPGCELPEHVIHRLARDYHCYPLSKKDIAELPSDALPADLLYMTHGGESHQLQLVPDVQVQLSQQEHDKLRHIKGIDAVYSTRLQKERLHDDGELADYPMVDSKFLKEKRYRHAKVMHPLPRVGELSYELDEDPRGVYFQQAAYGVPVRMALIAGLLGLDEGIRFAKRGPKQRYPIYSHPDGIECVGETCVSRLESEQRYLVQKFAVVKADPLTVRCAYCDREQQPRVISRSSRRKYSTEASSWQEIDIKDLVLFSSEASARAAGHEPRKTPLRPGGRKTVPS